LTRARAGFGAGIRRVLTRNRPIDASLYEELADTLILGDTGVAVTTSVLDELQTRAGLAGATDAGALRELLVEILSERLGPAEELRLPPAPAAGDGPPGHAQGDAPRTAVVMVVGVNGTGKTTTVARLAHRLLGEGRKPLIVQADTFRAAATEQALVWAQRLGLDLVHHRPGSDPAAVAFDGVRAAVARGRDVVLVDTAGRLHTKTGLVEELRKVRRVLAREVEGAPHETLLVIDGTAGLNSLEQARVFDEALDLTGIVITKMDGTARGGVVIAIREALGVPVKFVGVGERLDDLVPFDAEAYAREMVGSAGA